MGLARQFCRDRNRQLRLFRIVLDCVPGARRHLSPVDRRKTRTPTIALCRSNLCLAVLPASAQEGLGTRAWNGSLQLQFLSLSYVVAWLLTFRDAPRYSAV